MSEKVKNKVTKVMEDNLKVLNVSDSIRYLNSLNFSRNEISVILKKRYQHVRNVLVEDERLEKVYLEDYFKNKINKK